MPRRVSSKHSINVLDEYQMSGYCHLEALTSQHDILPRCFLKCQVTKCLTQSLCPGNTAATVASISISCFVQAPDLRSSLMSQKNYQKILVPEDPLPLKPYPQSDRLSSPPPPALVSGSSDTMTSWWSPCCHSWAFPTTRQPEGSF